jgi:hypothetical protein
MNEKTEPLPRFAVRKGAAHGTWMVWDREARRPAKVDAGGLATNLTEERARAVCDVLMRAHFGTEPPK